MLQHQGGLDKASNAGRRMQVADIGLDRANHAGSGQATTIGTGERLDLNRVAQQSAGAMGFDIADTRRIDSGQQQCFADHALLSRYAGSHEVDLI